MSPSPEPTRAADPAFWTRGYAVVPDLVDQKQLAFLRGGIAASLRGGRMQDETESVASGALDEYCAPAAELLLKQSLPVIAAVIGRALLPSYGYWRVYGPGATLSRHLDRESCEISVTLPIESEPDTPVWPIHFRDLAGTEVAVELSPGAGAIYRGAELPHWRKAFTGRSHSQIFLHYVLADGDFTEFAFDRRSGLAIDHRSAD